MSEHDDETRAAMLAVAAAWKLLDLQQDVQPDRAALAAILRDSCAARLVVEVPKRGVDVPVSVMLSVLDADGGEREIRMLRISEGRERVQ
jgi:hypothetical protein